MTRPLALVLLVFTAVLGLAALRLAPPAPLGAGTPSDRFSALRAREIQGAISGGSRVVGSAQNEKARVLLEGELQKAGFATQLQRATSCSRHGSCGRVTNIVATRAGSDPTAFAVLLMAHYDSVACSPGASDDGVGVAAVLETARALGSAPPLRRTVIVVLTDGEEAGLLGAQAFMVEHPLAARVRGAVNVDARGSRGPSAMFETSRGNAWLIGLFAKNAERPVTSSLFYEVYRRMPNDTDFTIVKERAQGLNFANVASIDHYHTPLDTLENADLGTLQHHGDQALAMVRALGNAGPELDARPDANGRDAVWFDVLALVVVRWPASASLGLALVALALIAGWAVRFRAFGVALLAPLCGLVAALLAALAASALLGALGAFPVPWVAHPILASIALHGASLTAGLCAARFAARGARAEVLWAGTWLTWGALGVAATTAAPGACFLFVVPTLLAGFVAFFRIEVASALPAVAASILWLPFVLLAYDGLGFAVPLVGCMPTIVLVSTLPALNALRHGDGAANAGAEASDERPALERSAQAARFRPRALAFAAVAGVVVAALAAALAPKFSAAHPQRVNVMFRQDSPGDGTTPPARVYVEAAWGPRPWGAPPEAMIRALGPASEVRAEAPLPTSPLLPFAFVPRAPLAAPAITILPPASPGRTAGTRVRVASRRGATTLVVLVPTSPSTFVRVDEKPATPGPGGVLVLRGVPAEGMVLTITTGRAPTPLTVLDVTSGLPAEGAAPVANAVLAARPPEATQTQDGDVTLVATSIDLSRP